MEEEVFRKIRQEGLIEEGVLVLAGLSGGADSVCMLLLLAGYREKIGFSLCAVHVEHGIRGEESRRDAGFAEALCKKHGISCRTFYADVPGYARRCGVGLEEAARVLRHDCLAQEAVRQRAGKTEGGIRIALAHHAGDLAETVLFQLVRGSGFAGLDGMRSERTYPGGAVLIRPLLMCTRSKIEAYLRACGQEYCEDSTNMDVAYSRNRLRHRVLPELTLINSRAVEHIARTAGLMGELADYFDWQSAKLLPLVCSGEAEDCIIHRKVFLEYPPVLQRELLLRILARAAGSRRDLGAVHVEAVRELFASQNGRYLTLPYRLRAERVYDGVRIRRDEGERRLLLGVKEADKAAKRRVPGKAGEAVEFEVTQETLSHMEQGQEFVVVLPDGKMYMKIFPFCGKMDEIPKKKYTKWLNYDKIKGRLQIRGRRPGDFLVTDDQGHTRKLREYFIGEKIPQSIRDGIWLLAEASHILWVTGGRISAGCKIEEHTGKILEVRITGGSYYEDQKD